MQRLRERPSQARATNRARIRTRSSSSTTSRHPRVARAHARRRLPRLHRAERARRPRRSSSAKTIALVIADQVMPGMSGVEFLEKAIERSSRGPIRMLLTGYADVASIVRAVNEGRIYRYIQKPWEPDELRAQREARARGLLAHRRERAARRARSRTPTSKLRAENLYLRREVAAPLRVRSAHRLRARRCSACSR